MHYEDIAPVPRFVGAATLAQVALAAGVSTITASRALGNPRMVSPQTVERVKAAAQRIGYVPNLLAGGLKSRRSRLVAMLLPAISGSPFLRTIQALTDTLSVHGYQVMLGQIGYDHGHEDGLLDAIIGRRPDGIVVSGLIRSEAARDKLRASGIPVVETWSMSEQPVDMLIGFSHERVGAEVAAHLWSKGRRRFAIVSADDLRGTQRREGFVKTLRAMAARSDEVLEEPPHYLVPAPSTVMGGRQALQSLLRQAPQLDAVYCNSDVLALGVLIEAQALGIAVPQQLAVFGFGDTELAAAMHPGLSTVRVDDIAIGQEAARRIIARAEGVDAGPSIVDVGFSIVERGSC